MTGVERVSSRLVLTDRLVQRFWRRVSVTDTCWLWTGARRRDGYGVMTSGKRGTPIVAVHQLSFLLHRGPIPTGRWVLHTCDVRHCVRPEHLWAGTALDNYQDMRSKGRGKASVTPGQVREMRALAGSLTQQQLAERFRITQTNVSLILTRKTWRDV
jgi:hypothetical protein